jgi:hypothetical protein
MTRVCCNKCNAVQCPVLRAAFAVNALPAKHSEWYMSMEMALYMVKQHRPGANQNRLTGSLVSQT